MVFSTATPSGGADFKRNETWNLGQMCRNLLEHVHIVGFYSYDGSVHAARRWGGEGNAVVHNLRHRLGSIEF